MLSLRPNLSELDPDYGWVSTISAGFCLKIPKFWIMKRISAELGQKLAWVRPKLPSELGAQNRKNNPGQSIVTSFLLLPSIMNLGSVYGSKLVKIPIKIRVKTS